MAFGELRSILRVTYNTKDSSGDQNATLRLASAADVMGTQSVFLPGLAQAYIAPSLTLTSTGPINWWASYGANIGVDDGVEHRLSAGLKMHF